MAAETFRTNPLTGLRDTRRGLYMMINSVTKGRHPSAHLLINTSNVGVEDRSCCVWDDQCFRIIEPFVTGVERLGSKDMREDFSM